MAELPLLGVPNFSEGRDPAVIEALERALEGPARRGRAGEGRGRDPGCWTPTATPTTTAPCSRSPPLPAELGDALLRAAAVAVEEIDVMGPAGEGHPQAGQHPHVGALDVAPIVYLDPELRGRGVRGGVGAGRPDRRGARRSGLPLRGAHGLGGASASVRARSCAGAGSPGWPGA